MDKEKEMKEVKEREGVLKREYAWCVVQVDRANFMLRNALWGVALGMHAQVNNNFQISYITCAWIFFFHGKASLP